MLGQEVLQLEDERCLVVGELRPVAAAEIEGELIRRVGARDGRHAVVVHLLGQLPRELDRLHRGAEGAAEHPLEEALDLLLDSSKDAHHHPCCPVTSLAGGRGAAGARARAAGARGREGQRRRRR